jgi:hypothetical protein
MVSYALFVCGIIQHASDGFMVVTLLVFIVSAIKYLYL